jgi:LuxR family maltose regulon positive regulatory protein
MTPDLKDSVAQDLLSDCQDALGRLTVDGVTAPPLTAAETRVLQFLPSHLQLPQIGEHLTISTNTVKTHIRAIHHKLGVSTRGQAVERAQELGLLEAPAYD